MGQVIYVLFYVLYSTICVQCCFSVTRNNKGVYVWPQTVVGFTAELPCEATDFDSIFKQYAYHGCDNDGKWQSLNTSLCPFASKTTRLLQDFLRVIVSRQYHLLLLHLSIHLANFLVWFQMNLSEEHGPAIVESAQQLLNLSCGTPSLSDKMDAIFLSRAISNYLKFLPKDKEVQQTTISVQLNSRNESLILFLFFIF